MSFLGNLLGGVANAVGSLPFIGESAKGIISPIIGALGGATQESEQRQYQNDYAWTQMHNQFLLNSELMDKANGFASSEAQIAREWNSLPAQMARAGDAGINPLAILGSTGAGGSTAQASPVSASVGLPSMSHMPNGMLDLAALSQVLMNTSQGIKNTKETARYDEQIDALLDNYAADIALKKAQKDAQDIANDITRTYGKTEAAYRCLKLFSESLTIAQQGKLAAAQAKVSDATEALRKSEKETVDMERPLIKQRMEKEVELVGRQAETEKTKQEENRASAQEHRAAAENLSAKTKTENEVRASVVGISKAEHALKNYEVRYKSQYNKIALDKLASELRQQLDEETLTAIQKYDAENYSALHRLLFSNERKGEDVGKALQLLSKYSKYSLE